MKFARLSLAAFALMLVTAAGCMAQTTADVFTGVGFTTNSAATVTDFNGDTVKGPTMRNTMMMFGGTAMINDHFGVNGEVLFRPDKTDYVDLQYRPVFYDFNLVYQPLPKAKKFVPEFMAGIGGVNMRYYYTQSYSDSYVGNQTYTGYYGSSKHFQTHLGAGLKIYMTDNFYIKPQVDLHYVANFTQFGSNMTPRYGVAIGYTFGK